jgi:DNA-binding IclR family transcriptional regulator
MSFNTLAKSLDIIDLLMKTKVNMNVTEISKELKMPKSTTYKYLAILRDKGFLEFDNTAGTYMLGFKFLEFASVVQSQSQLDKIAFPHMKKLYLEVKETIILSVLKFGKAYCLERIEGEGGIVFSMQRGSHLPLHCGASAKVLLAFSDEDVDTLLGEEKLKKYTPYTITDPEVLKKHLQEIKKAGYAFSDQEVDIGARAISAPIFNKQKKLAGALCIVGPVHRFSEERMKVLKKSVIDYAKTISAELG